MKATLNAAHAQHLVIAALICRRGLCLQDQISTSTLQAERVAKLRHEIRRERDTIAVLRAEWAQGGTVRSAFRSLAQQHLKLEAYRSRRNSITLDRLPERPPQIVPPGTADPIGAIIETSRAADSEVRDRQRCPHRSGATMRWPIATNGDRIRASARGRAAIMAATAARCSVALRRRAPIAARKSQRAAGLAICAFRRDLLRSSRGRLVHVRRVPRQPCSAASPAAQDAVATARPDILDRNGADPGDRRQGPVVVRRAAHASSIWTRRSNCSPPSLPDLDARELRERLASKKGFVWLKREITPKQQQRDPSARPSRRRLPAGEQARLSQRARSFRMSSAMSTSTTRASPASRNISTPAAWPTCIVAGFATDRAAEAGVVLAIDLRVQHALRDELRRA